MRTFLAVNAMDLYAADAEEQLRRYAGVEALLRESDADVIAVQELKVPRTTLNPRETQRFGAAVRLRWLADAVGRRCDTGDRTDDLLLAVGGDVHHVGLLWNEDTVAPLPGRVARFGRDNAGMWHSMVTAVVDLGDGVLARVGSVHLSPFDQDWALRDANQILRAVHADTTPGFLGGDFNGISSARVPAPDGGTCCYDPDPYAGQPWHPSHAYQLAGDGTVDRRAAHRLEAAHLGRLQDCAVLTGQPWTPTSAHYPGAEHPPRRVDRWYATGDVPAAALLRQWVVPAARVGTLTDHCPIGVEIDPAALSLSRLPVAGR